MEFKQQLKQPLTKLTKHDGKFHVQLGKRTNNFQYGTYVPTTSATSASKRRGNMQHPPRKLLQTVRDVASLNRHFVHLQLSTVLNGNRLRGRTTL